VGRWCLRQSGAPGRASAASGGGGSRPPASMPAFVTITMRGCVCVCLCACVCVHAWPGMLRARPAACCMQLGGSEGVPSLNDPWAVVLGQRHGQSERRRLLWGNIPVLLGCQIPACKTLMVARCWPENRVGAQRVVCVAHGHAGHRECRWSWGLCRRMSKGGEGGAFFSCVGPSHEGKGEEFCARPCLEWGCVDEHGSGPGRERGFLCCGRPRKERNDRRASDHALALFHDGDHLSQARGGSSSGNVPSLNDPWAVVREQRHGQSERRRLLWGDIPVLHG